LFCQIAPILNFELEREYKARLCSSAVNSDNWLTTSADYSCYMVYI